MRYIILLISVLLITLLVFQNYKAHRGVPDADYGDSDPIVVRQKAADVNQFIKDTAESQRRAIDEQLQ